MVVLCHALFGAAHIFGIFPDLVVTAAMLTSRQEKQTDGKPARSWTRLILLGIFGGIVMALFSVFGFFIPIGLALGPFPQWSDTPWHGIVASLIVDAGVALADLWLFFCGKEANRAQASLKEAKPGPENQ